MTKTFISGMVILTITLGAFGAQAMTSEEPGRKAVEPQVHDKCTEATWPQIPAVCLEGGNDRFNVAFE
jgi:hypothetical protein